MKQLLYNIDAVLITGVLFVLMLAVIEVGYRFGSRRKDSATEMTRDHLGAIQASILGLMGLLLAFTFSLSVQRFDTRSDAVVDEANAIGTAYLRTQLLPPALRSDVQALLRDYVDLRVQASDVSIINKSEWDSDAGEGGRLPSLLWDYARRAAELNPNPVISGLFIQALNEMIDSYGRNVAQVSRQVPQPVLILLFGTLLVAGGAVGLTAGSGGQRPSLASFAMVTLILGLTFVILDLDRPQRGRITVSNQSLLDLQARSRLLPRCPLAPRARQAAPSADLGPGGGDQRRRERHQPGEVDPQQEHRQRGERSVHRLVGGHLEQVGGEAALAQLERDAGEQAAQEGIAPPHRRVGHEIEQAAQRQRAQQHRPAGPARTRRRRHGPIRPIDALSRLEVAHRLAPSTSGPSASISRYRPDALEQRPVSSSPARSG